MGEQQTHFIFLALPALFLIMDCTLSNWALLESGRCRFHPQMDRAHNPNLVMNLSRNKSDESLP